jgi:hypothetical protein
MFFKGIMSEIKDKVSQIDHTIFYEEGKLFGWSEKAFMGIKDNHKFIVETYGDNQTRFIQSDKFEEGAIWLIGRRITKVLCEKHTEFNRSLKAEVERRFKK